MSESTEHPLEQLATVGIWGGPTYPYRGAEIRCLPGGHICGLFLVDHPLHGSTFGVAGTITPLVDLWLEERRLPAHYKVAQRP